MAFGIGSLSDKRSLVIKMRRWHFPETHWWFECAAVICRLKIDGGIVEFTSLESRAVNPSGRGKVGELLEERIGALLQTTQERSQVVTSKITFIAFLS